MTYPQKSRTTNLLLNIFHRLHNHFGDQHWWPAETRFEIIIGAILTQSTSWKNVEKAIANLKHERLLDCQSLVTIDEKKLAQLIRSSGYFNTKAKKLKAFVTFFHQRYHGNLNKMFAVPLLELRTQLLSVYGIGEETADSILLYAGNKPIFVIDAYTKRIFTRLGLVNPKVTYSELQTLFMSHLPPNPKLFNEYHALLVALGKNLCTKRPRCSSCPLNTLCLYPR
ncbi:MAG: endonuclease III domain-containing protein [bacterium]|nr:endonuclease III domain-containing protein [bacterium]